MYSHGAQCQALQREWTPETTKLTKTRKDCSTLGALCVQPSCQTWQKWLPCTSGIRSHGGLQMAWALAGFGHCQAEVQQHLETNLRLCLRRCEASATACTHHSCHSAATADHPCTQESEWCAYASFADTAVLHQDTAHLGTPVVLSCAKEDGHALGWGRCWLFERCLQLVSTRAGAATFAKRPRGLIREPEGGDSHGLFGRESDESGPLWTISLSTSLAESLSGVSQVSQPQLCAENHGQLRLRLECQDPAHSPHSHSYSSSLFKVEKVAAKSKAKPKQHRGRHKAGKEQKASAFPKAAPLLSILVAISWKRRLLCGGLASSVLKLKCQSGQKRRSTSLLH